MSIARNVLVDHMRRKRPETPLPGPDELGMPEMATDAVAVRDGLAGTAFGDREDELTQDFFGRVGRPPLGHATETPLTYARYNVGTGNQPKEHMRKVLARLPETMNALAVVEFTAPHTGSQLSAFGGRYGSCPDLAVYENRPRSTPITWGRT